MVCTSAPKKVLFLFKLFTFIVKVSAFLGAILLKYLQSSHVISVKDYRATSLAPFTRRHAFNIILCQELNSPAVSKFLH